MYIDDLEVILCCMRSRMYQSPFLFAISPRSATYLMHPCSMFHSTKYLIGQQDYAG
jgi:hypothetical protein